MTRLWSALVNRWRGGRPGSPRARPFGRIVSGISSEKFADCVAVSMPFDWKSARPSAKLFDEMQRREDVRPELRDGELALRTMPFRHVILRGDIDHFGAAAHMLKRDVSRNFSSYLRDFYVDSFEDASIRDLRAYFGFGVFLPGPNDRQVADLEFSWFEPKPGAPVLAPGLAGQATGAGPKPAAWFEGQIGLALSFNPELTPAVISRDGAPHALAAFAKELDSTVLFFGRRFDAAPPDIEAFSITLDARRRSTVNLPSPQIDREAPEWWLHDGWQTLSLFRQIPLWFRIVNRTGDAPFVPRSRMAEFTGRRLIVRGILLPRPEALPFGGLSRWWVDFTHSGELRTRETMDRFRAATAQWGRRYAVYDHKEFRYSGREDAVDDRQVLAVATGRLVTRFNYDPEPDLKVIDQPPDLLRRLYRRDRVDLLAPEPHGKAAFGVVPLQAKTGRYEVSGGQEVPSDPADPARRGDPAIIGLDWLNRAAGIEVAGRTRGLAEAWMSRMRSLSFDVAANDRLSVRAAMADGPIIEYEIPADRLMPLGPLYVEYKAQ